MNGLFPLLVATIVKPVSLSFDSHLCAVLVAILDAVLTAMLFTMLFAVFGAVRVAKQSLQRLTFPNLLSSS